MEDKGLAERQLIYEMYFKFVNHVNIHERLEHN